MEVEHVVRHQQHVHNQQIQYKEHIVQQEQVVVRHVEMENIQQQHMRLAVVTVQLENIVQVEK